MQTYLAIGEAPQLAIGLWILLATCFLGAFGVGMYGVKDVLRDEWAAYRAERPATAAARQGRATATRTVQERTVQPEAGRAA